MMKSRLKIALALGGGGVRALSQIGILRVFERGNIPIDLITGTSMGAILAAAYALEPDVPALQEKITKLLKRKEITDLESLAAHSESEEKGLFLERLSLFMKRHWQQTQTVSVSNRPLPDSILKRKT